LPCSSLWFLRCYHLFFFSVFISIDFSRSTRPCRITSFLGLDEISSDISYRWPVLFLIFQEHRTAGWVSGFSSSGCEKGAPFAARRLGISWTARSVPPPGGFAFELKSFSIQSVSPTDLRAAGRRHAARTFACLRQHAGVAPRKTTVRLESRATGSIWIVSVLGSACRFNRFPPVFSGSSRFLSSSRAACRQTTSHRCCCVSALVSSGLAKSAQAPPAAPVSVLVSVSSPAKVLSGFSFHSMRASVPVQPRR
jgi:hypothetical protein